MAAEWVRVVQAVQKLQARLAAATHPHKLQKYLKKLSALPMTPDLLAATGVRRTVKRLRKHELVGSFARDLAARWKKLALRERSPGPEPRGLPEDPCCKRPTEALPEEEEVDGGYQENSRASKSPSSRRQHGPEEEPRKPRRHHKRPHSCARSEESNKRPRVAASSPAWGSPDGSRVGPASRRSTSPPQMSVDLDRSPEDPEPTAAGQEPGRGHTGGAFRHSPGLGQEGPLGGPQEKGPVSHSRVPHYAHKEAGLLGAEGDEKSPALMVDKSHRAFPQELKPKLFPGESAQERPASGGPRKAEGRERPGAKFSAAFQVSSEDLLPKPKAKAKPKARGSRESPSDENQPPAGSAEDPLPKAKEFPSSRETQNGELEPPDLDRKSVREEFLEPSKSFEACLVYDQPGKKKRKAKTAATARRAEEPREDPSQSSRATLHPLQNFPLVSGNQWQTPQPAEVDSAKRQKVSTEAPLVPPDPPCPMLQANCSPPPAYGLLSFLQPDGKALSSPQKAGEAAWTGRRVHSKTRVYSGSQGGYLPQETSHQPCSQVLAQDIESVSGVRGIPSPLLAPPWEKCAPDGLHHVERHNQVLLEETDELWRIHCQKEFKEEKPKENESWQEMYLRLRDARERRLGALTASIRSAHAHEPQGRKTKMIFFRSPCDVPRRQEESTSGGAAVQPAQCLTGSRDTRSRSSKSRCRAAGGLSPAAQGPTDPSLHPGQARLAPEVNARKTTAKKVAPLMAKTIRDYKRKISRR